MTRGDSTSAAGLLSGVSETALISLAARCLESRRADGIIKDLEAIEVVERLGVDPHRFGDMRITQLGTAIRTEILDRQVKAFLRRWPSASVVSLGAGLGTGFYRLDNGALHWVDLDLPEVEPVWKEVFEETERHQFLAASVLDFAWMDRFAGALEQGLLLIAEGLLMYLQDDDVRFLVVEMARRLPGAELLFEFLSPWMAHRTRWHPTVSATEAEFHWGIASAADLERWDRNIRLVGQWFYLDYYRRRWGWMRFLRWLPIIRKLIGIAQVRFAATDRIRDAG